jgi:AcrR family transcriptional regulator
MPKAKYHHGDLKNALIAAGIDILSKEGVQALSLRAVAQRAGVSHAAPYAHYTDKQALIAAISTEGYRRLYASLEAIGERYAGNPARQLVEGAWAYAQFALHDPAHFKITFSSVLEKEHEYPAFVEMSQRSFGLVVGIVERCQAAGILGAGPPDLLAVSVWGLVHGFVFAPAGAADLAHHQRSLFAPRDADLCLKSDCTCRAGGRGEMMNRVTVQIVRSA